MKLQFAAALFGLFVLGCEALSGQSAGLSAEQVLAKMSNEESAAYLAGMVDSFLFMERPSYGGNAERGECIRRWFYGEKRGEPAKGPKDVLTFFEANPAQPAVGLIKILIDRECGKRPKG
jgi:hypothetical protein